MHDGRYSVSPQEPSHDSEFITAQERSMCVEYDRPFGRFRGTEQLQSLLYSIISGVLAPYRGSCNSLASPSSHSRAQRSFIRG